MKPGAVHTEVSATLNFLPGRHLCVLRDVTERKRLEEQLRQSQKMDAIGQLAGGIAHDFNNLLLVISGYGQFALTRLNGNDVRLRHDLEEMLRAAEQAAGLTRQLLAFSRRQILKFQTVDLNNVISDTETLLRRVIGEDIQVVSSLPADLGSVKADPGQIVQVLLNLALNARDAMPGGGTLTIETANVELDKTAGQALFGAAPGSYIVLAVADTGCGMVAEARTRAFEPFYTTKPVGEGTGLGLSTVYGIVKQSDGYISIDSEPGEGTLITIYLPRNADPGPTRVATGSEAIPAGSAAILLVEDDEVVRSLVAQMLEQQGWNVTTAAGADEAIKIANSGDRCDLLITDVVMPAMNGRELAKRLTASRPGLKVIFMSGYTSPAIVERGVLEEDTIFLQKPFSIADVKAKVRQALDTPLATRT